MRQHTRRIKNRLNRRTALIVLLAIVVIAGGVVAIRFGAIAAADSKAEKSLTDTKNKIVAMTKDLNATFASTSELVSKKSALATYVSDVKDQVNTTCSEERTLIYYALITKHDACENSLKALMGINSTANNLLSFLNDEETLSALLPVHTTTLSSIESYDLWKRTSDLIAASKTGTQALDLKKSLQSAAEKYRDAWADLVKADTNKDETAFTKAEESVNTAYYELTTQSSVAEVTLKALTVDFNSKYASYLSLKN